MATGAWITSSWNLSDSDTVLRRRARNSLERLRRIQLRPGSVYSSLRSMVPVLGLALTWVVLIKSRPDVGSGSFMGRNETVRHVLMATCVLGLWNWWLSLSPYELRSVREDLFAEIYRLLSTSTICGMTLFGWGVRGNSFAHGSVLACVATLTLIALSLLLLTCFVIASALSTRVLRKRVALVVGSGPRARVLKANMHNHSSVIEVIGCIDDEFVGSDEEQKSYLGSINELPKLLKSHPIELVLIGLPFRSMYDEIQRVVEICESIGVESHYLQDIFKTDKARLQKHAEAPQDFNVLSTLTFRPTLYIKRVMDVVGASALLALFSPLMLGAAIAIKFSDPGPIFFVQQRFGRYRILFPMFKFRSMIVDAERRQAGLESINEAQGPVFKLKSDPRITRVGAFLRRTSIDELPQLLNVLRGEMSLVGPRPLPVRDVSRFEEAWLLRRFTVRPGLTCIWQVNGRSDTAFDSWIRQDLEYIDSWSLSLDVSILVRTIPAVLRGSGAV